MMKLLLILVISIAPAALAEIHEHPKTDHCAVRKEVTPMPS